MIPCAPLVHPLYPLVHALCLPRVCLAPPRELPAEFLGHSGAWYAHNNVMPKAICKANGTERGFITTVLAPVNCRHEPKVGILQTLWLVLLAFGTVGLMRLLLAN